jgi:hypothetical protein
MAKITNQGLNEESFRCTSEDGRKFLAASNVRSLSFQPKTLDMLFAVEGPQDAHLAAVLLKKKCRFLRKAEVEN